MSVIAVSAENIGAENPGELKFESIWRLDSRHKAEVEHRITVSTIHVVPSSVLYRDNEPERPNSLKRLNYMLSLRAYTELSSVDDYISSLAAALTQREFEAPTERRLGTLKMLAKRYTESLRTGRVNHLGTRTAGIFSAMGPYKAKSSPRSKTIL